MKKRGFTLIELLAVIVIISVVAVIAVPIILNVINNSKKEAIKQSAVGYVDAIEKTILKNKTENDNTNYDGDYTINKTKIIKNSETASLLPILDLVELNVNVKGEVPKTGNVTIKNLEVKTGKFYYNNYLVTLNNGKYSVQILSDSNDSKTIESRIQELENKVQDLETSKNELESKIATLQNQTNYSTTETKVGKWIDGKDLYRKTFTYGAIPSNSWVTIGTIENMDNGFIDTSASYFVNDNSNMAAVGARIPVVVSGRNVSTATYTVYTTVYSNGKILTGFGSTAKASSMVVTVLYTKK